MIPLFQSELLMAKRLDPLDSFGFLSIRIGRLIARKSKEKLQGLGLQFPPSCMGILADLFIKDGLSQTELGSCVIKNKSSINKMLEALEEEGMIERIVDASDKRVKRIYLTEESKHIQREIKKSSSKIEGKLLTEFSENDIRTTKAVLRSLYQHLMTEAAVKEVTNE